MAGLIVIDFIDMEQQGHVRKVEKAMKEALKNDRARIQVGRISSFGLMEMSRQRLRTGVLEASTRPCPHCEGTGLMRTAASAGLSALRIVEDEAARGRGEKICLRAGRDAAVYVLNKKRAELADIEQRYGVSIEILIDESLEGARMSVESSGGRPTAPPRIEAAPVEEEDEEETLEISLEDEEAEEPQEREAASEGEAGVRRRRRRRRGGRGRRREGVEGSSAAQAAEAQQVEPESSGESSQQEAPEQGGGQQPKRRRRRRSRNAGEQAAREIEPDSSPMVERPIDEEPPIAETEAPAEAKPKRRRSKKAAEAEAAIEVPEPAPAEAPPAETADQSAPPAAPVRKTRAKRVSVVEAPVEAETEPTANNDGEPNDETAPQRRGWWQRTIANRL
jgi:ribonuclease E